MTEKLIDQFHFLRPFWLLIIPLAIALGYQLRQRFRLSDQWRGAITNELLIHMTVPAETQNRFRPYQLMTAALVLGSVAMAGPTWQREITPFTQDRAPLIVALELTPTMLGIDQQPTRLDRAKQKIRDILKRRKGARTAVIGYAGSAHAVLPLTDDADLIETYLQSLLPEVMPKQGDDASTALMLAATMLETEEASGTIVFMTDGIDRIHAPSFSEFTNDSTASSDQVLILSFGTQSGGAIDTDKASGKTFGLINGLAPAVDLVGLSAVAKASGTSLLRATADTSDIDELMRKVRSNLVNSIQQNEKLQWRDFGYVLVWPLALIILVWARRGWTVRWT